MSSTTIGEFLFALGFSPPNMKPLTKATTDAQKAVNDATKLVAEGAKDAQLAVERASVAVKNLAKKNKETVSGLDVALQALGKSAKDTAAKITGAWKDPEKLTEAWGAALGRAKTGILAIGGAASAAAVGIGAIVQHTAESDAELVRWSARLGVSVEELSKLEQAAAGFADKDAVRESIQTLNEGLGELSSQGSGPALEALRTLGLGLDDLAGKGPAEQLARVSDALAKVGANEGTEAILKLFGGGDGAKLIPFLKQGSAGMAELAKEAERLGLVVGGDAAKGSADFARELGQVIAMVKAVVADLARGLMPAAREYIAVAKAWIAENRELLKQRIAEFLERLIPMLVDLAKLAASLVQAFAGLVESLGGLGNALTIAAVAFGALQIAALGIPGVILAASAALAIGISELSGYRQEAARLREETEQLQAGSKKFQGASAALDELSSREKAGTLADLSDAEYEKLAEAVIVGGSAGGLSDDRVNRTLDRFDKSRGRQGQRKADIAAADRLTDFSSRETVSTVLGQSFRKRAKKRGLSAGAIDAAIATAQQSLREGGSIDAAEKAGLARIDSVAGYSAGVGAGKDKIDTRQADELFGDEIRRLAEREGVGAAGVKSSLEAAASSLKEGAARDVARSAGLGRLGGLAGKDLSPAKGKDPLLSEIFGKDVPDIELSAIARGAQPQVLISNITNNLTVNAPIQVDGSGDPVVVGQAAASALKSEFKLAVSQASRTVKPPWSR